MKTLTLAAALLGSVALGSTAQAQTVAALVGDNTLAIVDVAGKKIDKTVQVQGLSGRLLGIDVRPADGMLYGLVADGTVVTIDPASGKATQKSKLEAMLPAGTMATVDFNPAADRLRVMGMNGANLRVNAQTGEAAKDGRLKYAAGTPWAETAPRVVAGAYTNSMAGAQQTMLLTVDSLTRTLNLQAPPNDGVQQPRGEVAASLPAGVAFDILSDGQGNNRGFLLAEGKLHDVDLQTGRATPLGAVSGLPAGAEVIDIAAMR